VRVAIAEDQALLRDGLKRLFTDAGDDVVAEAGDAEGLLAAVSRDPPDLVVVDVRMPPTHTDEGTRAAREIRERHPEVGVLVLSQHVERRHVVDLLGHGGFGYLLKDRVLGVSDFLDAARRVAAGGSALDPVVVATLVAGAREEDPLAELTAREREVLELMAEGLTNAAIAKRLWLTERTVETHVRHVLLNLGLTAEPDGHRRVLAVLAYLRASQT
jgi:DNA-binding NarL/FixJ family response regulator